MRDQLLYHRVSPGKGRRGDRYSNCCHCRLATIAHRSPRPHVALDLCNGLYSSPTIPLWFTWLLLQRMAHPSLIVSPFLRWVQPHAVAAVPDDALRLEQILLVVYSYITLYPLPGISHFLVHSRRPHSFVTHTLLQSLVYSSTKRHQTPPTATPTFLSCIGA
jgi:hypothetical protein